MTSFDTLSKSIEGSRLVRLYQITLGVEVFRYTNVEDTINADGFDWLPVGVTNTGIGVGPKERTASVEIMLPVSNEFVQRYVNSVPTTIATVQIFLIQRGDPTAELKLQFKGVLRTLQFTNDARVAKLSCLPLEGGLAKEIPALGHSAQCPLMLFDLNCKAVRASFLYSGTVATVSANGTVITVPGLDAAKGVGWAKAGEVVVTTSQSRRMVLEHVATDTLTILFPFETSPLNAVVDVAAGCDHTLSTCASKFTNEINYGGFPFVPVKNVFATGLK